MRWFDQIPESGVVEALDHADARFKQHTGKDQDRKRHWSESFANQCAVIIANEFRKSKELKDKRILPESLEKGTEPLTPLGSLTSKRIDVTVADDVLGLEIGVSLKGLNFADPGSGYFDKNLTGRLYELGDEMRLVHEHLPHAFMAAILFLPLESTADKIKNSSFSNAIVKLRARTGRLDVALSAHAARCDAAFVGLYTTGKETGGYKRGVARFLNVESDPPLRGRPAISATLSLAEMVRLIIAKATEEENATWSEPEPDSL